LTAPPCARSSEVEAEKERTERDAVKINSFRVRKYRNIEDSGDVKVDGDLTCIVGKNQSGKTVFRATED